MKYKCANHTCNRRTDSKFCSRRCQLAARSLDQMASITVRIPMDDWHVLDAEAKRTGMTIEELVRADMFL